MTTSLEINDLAAALSKAQGKFTAVAKSSDNPFFKSKYAALPEVVLAAAPILSEQGLALTQWIGHNEAGQDILTTYLLHSTGQYLCDVMILRLTKQDAQGLGSAVTYARRYSYMAVLGLVADEEDDDGIAASGREGSQNIKAARAATTVPLKPGTVPGASAHPANQLVDPGLLSALRQKLEAHDYTGEGATTFFTFVIGKPKPTNTADVKALIEALDNLDQPGDGA